MTPIEQLEKLVTKESKLGGDKPIKWKSLEDDLFDANGDRKMHWWRAADDEFYAMCRNADLPAILAHVKVMEQQRDEAYAKGVRDAAERANKHRKAWQTAVTMDNSHEHHKNAADDIERAILSLLDGKGAK